MEKKAPKLEDVRAAVTSACRGLPVRSVEVFGSLARGGTRTGSDVDLLVDFLPGARFGLLEMGALKEDLEEMLGCALDLVSRKSVEKSTNPYRRRSMLSSPVSVYAR
jgi:predicted nucleotidyltransferase